MKPECTLRLYALCDTPRSKARLYRTYLPNIDFSGTVTVGYKFNPETPSNERNAPSGAGVPMKRDRAGKVAKRRNAGPKRRRVMLIHPVSGKRYKCPFARIAARIPVDPYLEAAYREDLFYDPANLLWGKGFVYLLRFSEPLRGTVELANGGGILYTAKQANYYLGYADNFPAFLARMYTHASRKRGNGTAAIMRECHRRGITVTLARLFVGLHKEAERAFKRRGSFNRLDPARNPDWRKVPSSEWLARYARPRQYIGIENPAPPDGLPF